ncbi:CmpA/NrtA family ABC transporter substrate-binding protein [Roseibium algae]|uniref:CmpA/NrtA family ABC transporter substrate-binding protein n=1 Tax=Roseibium algae TaxID=3123038 RepID=A0ABU8TGC4_9HYPH
MSLRSRDTIIAGYIPLLDSALLVAAARLGFAADEGIDLKLVRETSWANIRDRISVGHFDVAHMLGPMPIAASLNITSLAVPMKTAMTLGLGGNAITVSSSVWSAMDGAGASGDGDPASTGVALAKVIAIRVRTGQPPLRFGVVHPFSGHAYELRYWLAAAGIHPDLDVEITVLPPPLMHDALAVGQIDGFCVGEPWNTVAIQAGTGRIATFKEVIWPKSPEKVLGVTERWADRNPEILSQLIRALVKSAEWCGNEDNAPQLAALLANEEFLDCPTEACLPALAGQMRLADNGPLLGASFMTLSGFAAHCPRVEHGLWFYSQMVRWGQAVYAPADLDIVRKTFGSELYQRAVGQTEQGGAAAGHQASFFDDVPFDAALLEDYVAGFDLKS